MTTHDNMFQSLCRKQKFVKAVGVKVIQDTFFSVKINESIKDRPDVFQYCEEQYGDKWIWSRCTTDETTTIYLSQEQDAVAFKLKFDTV